MTVLGKLTIVAERQRRMQTKAEHRRAKLLEKLEEQQAMAQALIAGEPYQVLKRAWKTNEAGERVSVQRAKRLRPWYWMSAAGCSFSVWYGSKVVELKNGPTTIRVNNRDELPEVIGQVMEAVRAGELDEAVEAIAERGIPDIKLRTQGRPAKTPTPTATQNAGGK